MSEAIRPLDPPRRTRAQQPSRAPRRSPARGGAWSAPVLTRTIDELEALRADALRLERRFASELRAVHPSFRDSARNLVHYLALRDHDIRTLQEYLTALGLSSLGRTESHVLAGLDAVLRVLHRLAGREVAASRDDQRSLSFAEGRRLLTEHTEAVLGPPPAQRGTRIMVTMPAEAARDYVLVRQALANGMDCMRVNCAHDDVAAWTGMVRNLRRARKEVGRPCRILMDLGGPKLRTGPVDPASQVLRWKPERSERGTVAAPARIWLTPADRVEPPPGPAAAVLEVPRAWLRTAATGDTLRFADLRGKSRRLVLDAPAAGGRWATATTGAYLDEGRSLVLQHTGKASGRTRAPVTATVRTAAPERRGITLHAGDVLLLTATATPGTPAVLDERGGVVRPASISCTLPEVFSDVRAGERISFDDGRIGGVVEAVRRDALTVRITAAPPAGVKLRADKGINLPDSRLHVGALTPKDLADLDFVARSADLVGMSFVRTPEDVHELRRQLARRRASGRAIVLKIETTAAFEHLPLLLLAAMRGERVAVMIARGDLAVECGFERLAEVQEEVLWFCEAAHVPVIWATQVLEGLAKSGVPSRAEITDAAMGERAECVMLNKGPHVVEAVRVLRGILERMDEHQHKKSARLRRLRLSALATGA